jgi:hypothetical protein
MPRRHVVARLGVVLAVAAAVILVSQAGVEVPRAEL